MDPTIVALLGTLFGGVGLKVVEHWLTSGKVKVDEATTIRNELRLEVTALRAENKALEADVDKWRLSYYKMFQLVAKLKALLQSYKIDVPPDE